MHACGVMRLLALLLPNPGTGLPCPDRFCPFPILGTGPVRKNSTNNGMCAIQYAEMSQTPAVHSFLMENHIISRFRR